MKKRPSRRQTAKVSHSRWLAYATAGAATALGGNHSLEADIHYSGRLEVEFPRHSNVSMRFQLDQPGDSLWSDHFDTTSGGKANFNISAIGSAASFRIDLDLAWTFLGLHPSFRPAVAGKSPGESKSLCIA